MNCLLALLALCCLSAIQPVPIEKRFTQNFYAPVYRQDQAKLVVVHNSNLMTQHDSTKNYNKGAKRFKQSFNAPIMNQQNIEVLQSENFFGTQIHKVNIDNSKVRIPQYQSDRLVVRPRISPNDRLAVRPRERKFKRDLENQMVKRGFNQQFNGPIGSQQNIENYQKQDYWGSLQTQLNIDNSGQSIQPDVRPNNRPDVRPNSSPNVRPNYDQRRYKRDLENHMVKRGFNQQFNGPIGSQQNIENYRKQDYWGSLQTQLNIDNSGQSIQPQVLPNARPSANPNHRPNVRPNYDQRRYKRDLENHMVKRGFNQQFNGPIGSQQNIENYLKQDYFGSIMKQVNVDNSRQYKRSVKKSPFNRSLENQIIKRDFNQQYHGNIQTQQNIENYNKQDYWGSIQTQLNVDNSKSNNQVAPQPSVRPDVRPTVRPDVRPTVRPDVRPTVRPDVRPTVRPDVRPTVRPDVRPTVRPEVRPSPGLVVNHNVKPEESVSITNVVNNNQITVVKKGRKNGRKDKNRGSKNRGNKNDKGHGHRHGGNKWRNGNRNNYHGGNKHRGNNRWGNRWNNNFRYRRYRW